MARKPPRLNVVITPQAQRDINRIWDYNCDQYGPDHADSYINFLDKETAKLQTEYEKGKIAATCPELRYQLIRKGRGHGYVVIYEVVGSSVEVLHYYHTAQDWQGKLARGE